MGTAVGVVLRQGNKAFLNRMKTKVAGARQRRIKGLALGPHRPPTGRTRAPGSCYGLARTPERGLGGYDNMNLHAGASPQRKTFDPRVGAFMPAFTDNVRPIVGHPAEENNFLRFVFPPDWPHFTFGRLVDAAFKARACVQAFIANYLLLIQPPEEDGSRRFQLPLDHRANMACVCTYFPT